MVFAFNAAIAWVNLADAGVVAATSSALLTPPSQLQNPHIARKWRGAQGASESIVVDLGSAQSIDTVFLAGLNLTTAGTIRVLASNTDSSGQAGEVYDSGAIVGAVDEKYGYLVHLLSSAITARYVRVNLTQPGATYLEAGRISVCQRTQMSRNFSFDWSAGYIDRSRETEGRGGQLFIDPETTYRTLAVKFDAVTEAQRFSVFEELDRLNGTRKDVLFVADPSAGNLGRVTIWGLVRELSPTGGLAGFVVDGTPIYSKSFKIRERL